jgi:cell division protein FtsQ
MNSSGIQKAKMFFCFLCAVAFSAGMVHQYRKWIGRSSYFKVRGIEVLGNDLIRKEDLLKLGELKPDVSIWQVDLKATEDKLRSNPFLEKVTVTRKMPDGLCIMVEEKIPLAWLNFEGVFYCLDREGLVLPSKPGRLYDLPVLSGKFEGGISVGSRADSPWVVRGLDFLKIMLEDRPEMLPRISEVVLGKQEGIQLTTHRGGIPIWIGEGRIGPKIRCLEAILDELEQGNISQVEYIDLRFNSQVVVGMRT